MPPRVRGTVLTLVATVLLSAGCLRRVEEAALRPIDAAGLQQALESHRGQVVLVDFWATWCGPCLELFPHAVELRRRLSDSGLAVITVSLDQADHRPAVQKFLAEHNATTENYLSVYGVGPLAFTALEIDDGALPHVRLYDRQGNLRRTFSSGSGPIDPEEIERAVEALLGNER